MRPRTLSIVLALACVLTTAAVAAGPVLLQYKFTKGEVLRYVLDMKTEATFSTPDGGVRKTSMTNYMELTQEMIEKKETGDFRVAVTINKAQQTIDNKPAKMEIEPGHTVLLTMRPSGQIVEPAAGDMPAAGQTPQLQMVFPEKELKEKDNWEQTSKIQNPLPLETKTTYILAKIGADMPGYQGKVALIQSNMAMENTKAPTGESVDSKTSGHIWFDAERGRIVQSKAQAVFDLSLPMRLDHILPPNAVVKINFKIDINIRLAAK